MWLIFSADMRCKAVKVMFKREMFFRQIQSVHSTAIHRYGKNFNALKIMFCYCIGSTFQKIVFLRHQPPASSFAGSLLISIIGMSYQVLVWPLNQFQLDFLYLLCRNSQEHNGKYLALPFKKGRCLSPLLRVKETFFQVFIQICKP